jgi:hypothetical protein
VSPCLPGEILSGIEALVTLVRSHGEAYRRFVAGIAPRLPFSPGPVYERYLFALLSRHCELSRTVRAFRLLRGRCHTDAEAVAEILRDGRIGFYNTWAPQIAAFGRAYCEAPERFVLMAGEPFPDARERIARSVTGLGPAKTAFALGLVYPLDATVCCIDTHISRLLAPIMGCEPTAVSRRYQEAEALIGAIAGAADLAVVPTHWVLWDYQRHGTIDADGSESVGLIGPLFRREVTP